MIHPARVLSFAFIPLGFIGAQIMGEGGTGMANWSDTQWVVFLGALGAFIISAVIPLVAALKNKQEIQEIKKDQHSIAQVASPNVEPTPEAKQRVDEIAKNGA